jgi:hypothetical protein
VRARSRPEPPCRAPPFHPEPRFGAGAWPRERSFLYKPQRFELVNRNVSKRCGLYVGRGGCGPLAARVLTGRDPAPPLAGAALHGPASGCEADGYFFAGGADGRVHLLHAGPDADAAGAGEGGEGDSAAGGGALLARGGARVQRVASFGGEAGVFLEHGHAVTKLVRSQPCPRPRPAPPAPAPRQARCPNLHAQPLGAADAPEPPPRPLPAAPRG